MHRLTPVALLVLAACGTAPHAAPSDPPEGERLYEATAVVLESKQHDPMLCLGFIAESLPPQCGDVAVANWDWGAVEGEERLSGTTWGEYHVVGSYDGEAFSVSDVGPPRQGQEPFDDDPIEAPCPDPEGGWPWPDPARSSEEDLVAAQRAAQREPDFAGVWIDYLAEPNPDAPPDALQVILTAAFTGDLERHEAELRELWGGPLCIALHERTYRELRAIQNGLAAEEIGLQLLTSGVDVVDNVVEIHVVTLDEDDRRALDERYGEGTVRATAALDPVKP
ncbi:MAG TPA: hypothetical protein VHL78_07575 [Actinomycetota bacterium]|nr:hypothetical protein [Actinomycetota bacterium]